MGISSCLKSVTMIFLALHSFTVFQSGNTQWRPCFNPENYLNEELLTGFDDTQNYFISPASIKATLGMLLEGARSDAAIEISKALGVPLDQSRIRNKLQNMLYDLNDNTHGTTVQSANAVFLSKLYDIIPEYQQNIRQYYSAEVHPIDFSNRSIASTAINSRVRTSTNGLIPEIVSPEIFNADTEFVLANALYFKGQWKFEFNERITDIKCFYTRKDGCIKTTMMQTVNQFYYKSIDELSAQAIQLPYGDGRYAMVVLLPSEKRSVERLIKDLQHYSFLYIVRRLEPRYVSVNLPKFEIDHSGDIVAFLKNLDVTEIFTKNANLSGIVEKGQVKVNNIIHKAKIEVDEKGTIAAAATEVFVIDSSMPSFIANRPFLFFIYHVASNNVLFEGRLNEVPDRFFDYELLTGLDDTQNYFISPASIKITLGVVLEGARGRSAGKIKDAIRIPWDQSTITNQLQRVLYNLNDNSTSIVLQSANSAFISEYYRIIPEYKQNIQRYYSADIHGTSFASPSIASHTINSWVKTATKGIIPEIVSPEMFNADTRLVLANALYFKGQWTFEFDERRTAIKCFHTSKHGCIKTKMMQMENIFYYKFVDVINAQVIQLPYGDDKKYAMLVVLPSEKYSVEGIIKDLQHWSIVNIVERLELTEVSVNLPKFEIDYSGDIVPLLKTLGVREIFSRNANLSGIVENGLVKVNNFIHKAKIEVNEKGIITAKATGGIFMNSTTPSFIANRPFLFFIYDVASNNILFEGRLNKT